MLLHPKTAIYYFKLCQFSEDEDEGKGEDEGEDEGRMFGLLWMERDKTMLKCIKYTFPASFSHI